MNPQKWQKAKEIFNQAVELPLIERGSFLADACQDDEMRLELEKMLVFSDEEDDSTFEKNAFDFIKPEVHLPEKIGAYKIVREIGRGGMGVVYEAFRETKDFRQRVALKVIKRGMDTDAILSRFRHEQQILATLVHPNIASFLDGGMTDDGLAFYAMEYVEGKPLDDFIEEKNLGINERLEIFREVCSAVQFAHKNFVIHRDLKPSNIIVTAEGTPKLLDFGISKILSEESDGTIGTATSLGMMTPAYASPEQIRGERVNTATDIYSLGVILCEILTGQKPYRIGSNSHPDLVRAICESEPVKPSSLLTAHLKHRPQTNDFVGQTIPEPNPRPKATNSKSLKGDLDNIILKALQKEPENRYASVEQFSEDIHRYLVGLPITARSATIRYRVAKFIKRNRLAAIAGVLIFLSLVTGVAVASWQAYVAQKQRNIAERRFGDVRQLANKVVFQYHDAIADLPGSTAVREMLVKDASEYLDKLAQDAADNPELQHELAQAYTKIGKVQGSSYFANLGESAEAQKSFNKSIGIHENLVAKAPKNVEYLKSYLEVLDQKTLLLNRLNSWRESEETGAKMLEVSSRLTELEPASLDFKIQQGRAHNSMGDVVNFSGGHLASIEWYRRALAAMEKLLAENPQNELVRRNVVVPLQRIGTKSEYEAEILKEKGETPEKIQPFYVEAENVHRRSYEMAQALRRDFPESSVYRRYIDAIQINWGTALARIGRGAEGVPYILNSCKSFQDNALLDPQDSENKRDIAECFQYLAFAYDAMGEFDKAVKANADSLKILEEITVKDPKNFEFLSQAHLTYNNTGDIFLRQQKLGEALNFYRKGAEYVEKMSKLNTSLQINLLRSESQRKIGEAYLAIAEKSNVPADGEKAAGYLRDAKNELENLKTKNELSVNYFHKLELVAKELARAENLVKK